MYYTVIKHSGYLRTLEICRKHSPAARVFPRVLKCSSGFITVQYRTNASLFVKENLIKVKLFTAEMIKVLKRQNVNIYQGFIFSPTTALMNIVCYPGYYIVPIF